MQRLYAYYIALCTIVHRTIKGASNNAIGHNATFFDTVNSLLQQAPISTYASYRYIGAFIGVLLLGAVAICRYYTTKTSPKRIVYIIWPIIGAAFGFAIGFLLESVMLLKDGLND